jgi:hypothetical protein
MIKRILTDRAVDCLNALRALIKILKAATAVIGTNPQEKAQYPGPAMEDHETPRGRIPAIK